MRLNELTPGELTSQLKQQGIESPFGELSQEESTTIMDEFKAWYKYLRGKGFEMLGKGSFAAVLGKPDLNYVVKIPFKADTAWIKFANICIEHPNNPHLLKTKFLHKEANNFFVAVIEKLHPLNRGRDISLVYLVGRLERANDLNSRQTQEDIMDAFDGDYQLYRSVQKQIPLLFETVKMLQKVDSNLDLHGGNLMWREGTLVITDPYFDWVDAYQGRKSNLMTNQNINRSSSSSMG